MLMLRYGQLSESPGARSVIDCLSYDDTYVTRTICEYNFTAALNNII
jgi:hypothetical protein